MFLEFVVVFNSYISYQQSDCNLFSFTLQSIDNRNILERDGSYHLGDIVNKFVPGGSKFNNGYLDDD